MGFSKEGEFNLPLSWILSPVNGQSVDVDGDGVIDIASNSNHLEGKTLNEVISLAGGSTSPSSSSGGLTFGSVFNFEGEQVFSQGGDQITF